RQPVRRRHASGRGASHRRVAVRRTAPLCRILRRDDPDPVRRAVLHDGDDARRRRRRSRGVDVLMAVTYGSYLALDELLALQRPRSTPEHPDELLFIVVHQSSELWFKCMLHEVDQLVGAMERGEVMYAVLAVRRLNVLVQIVAAQLASLDTLPPQHF